jgi:hypothetical protein
MLQAWYDDNFLVYCRFRILLDNLYLYFGSVQLSIELVIQVFHDIFFWLHGYLKVGLDISTVHSDYRIESSVFVTPEVVTGPLNNLKVNTIAQVFSFWLPLAMPLV